MAIKVKNIATGEVKDVANTGLMDGKLFVFGKNEPTRWAAKYEFFKLTGNILASGAYNKWEIEFVEGMGYELCTAAPTRTRKAKVAEPVQNSQVTSVRVLNNLTSYAKRSETAAPNDTNTH